MLSANALTHLILIDHLLVLGRIITIPLVSLGLPAELDLHEHFISANTLASVLGSDFPRALNASLRAVGHCPTVSAGSFAELSGLLGVSWLDEASFVVGVNALLFFNFVLPLMV